MEYTQLSADGLRCSRLIWGVMKWGFWGSKLGAQDMLRLIEQGLERGLTTFDHADIYGDYTTEAEFGNALRLQPQLRQQMQLISKCGIRMLSAQRPEHEVKSYDTGKAHIIASAEQSLKNLATDHLDLLLIHRPSPLMNPDEVAEAFNNLLQAGKVLHFGVSNFTPSQFSLLHSRFPLVTNQIEASLLHLDPFFDGTLDQSLELRCKPMAWGPLGSGQIFSADNEPAFARIRETASKIVNARKDEAYSLDQVLLAWLLQHPAGILPVLGTTKIERVDAAIAALSLQLNQAEWFALLEAARGHEVA
jgi:predicted oxidoreductase